MKEIVSPEVWAIIVNVLSCNLYSKENSNRISIDIVVLDYAN